MAVAGPVQKVFILEEAGAEETSVRELASLVPPAGTRKVRAGLVPSVYFVGITPLLPVGAPARAAGPFEPPGFRGAELLDNQPLEPSESLLIAIHWDEVLLLAYFVDLT